MQKNLIFHKCVAGALLSFIEQNIFSHQFDMTLLSPKFLSIPWSVAQLSTLPRLSLILICNSLQCLFYML